MTEPDILGGTPSVRSLGELREQHVALLSVWRNESAPDLKAEWAAALRDAAQSLGRLLEDNEERDSAQSVIDYWTAALAALPGRSFPPLLTLAPFSEEVAAELASIAEGILAASGEAEIAAADALFLRLLRLGRDGRIHEASPVVLGEALSLSANRQLREILAKLADAGVVRLRPGQTPEEDSAEFASRAVARRWPRIHALFEDRRDVLTAERIRTAAIQWKQSGKNEDYLLTGGFVDKATLFLTDEGHAEDRVVNEFIRASKAKVERDRSRNRLALILGPSLAACLLLATGYGANELGEASAISDAAEQFNQGGVAAEPVQSAPSAERDALPTSYQVGPEGFVWIGSRAVPLLRDAKTGDPVQPEEVRKDVAYRVNSGANMWVRKGLPDDDNRSAKPETVAPAGSLVLALADLESRDRPSGKQYWLKVRVIPRVFIQYNNTSQEEAERFAGAIRTKGFDVPPVEGITTYNGIAEVRYYHGQDAPFVQTLSRAAAEALGRNEASANVRCRRLTMARPPAPTILELWINPRATPPSAASAAANGRSCASASEVRTMPLAVLAG